MKRPPPPLKQTFTHPGPPGTPGSRVLPRGSVALKVLTGVILLVVSVIIWQWYFAKGTTGNMLLSSSVDFPQTATYVVQRGSFDIEVITNGELAAKNQIELRSQVEGTTTIIDVLPEGTAVKKGQVIIRLADDKLKDKEEQETLNVEQARADKLAAEQDDAIEQNEADSNLKAARLKLELAKLDLEKWTRGDDPKKQRQLTLALQRAKRQLTRAKEDLQASEQLFKEDFISESELDDDRLKLIEAKAALETARLDITVYNKYTRPKEKKQVESAVEQAKAELDRTRRRNTSKLTRSRAKLYGKQRKLSLLEARLAKIREQLSHTIIAAPQDGMVVYASTVGPRWRRRSDPIAQGKQVRFNEVLIILPDTQQMVAKIKVHESQVSQVRVGQPVLISLDADPDKTVKGKVVDIGIMAEEGNWMNPDLREYAVKVSLPPGLSNKKFKPAMRCTARIKTGHMNNVLMIPIQAVVAIGSRKYCYILDHDQIKRQPVKLGKANETMVSVTQGLKEGQRVLLQPPDTTNTPEEKVTPTTPIPGKPHKPKMKKHPPRHEIHP